MMIIGYNRKLIFISLPIALILFFSFRLIELKDTTDVVLFTFTMIIIFFTPPMRNLGLWPNYEAVNEFGLHKIYFWGRKKNSYAWEEVVFEFKENHLFMFHKNNLNEPLFVLTSALQARKGSNLILDYIGTGHPHYSEVLKYSNSLKKNFFDF